MPGGQEAERLIFEGPACPVRNDLTQRQLAKRVGIHRRPIQAWEVGASYANAERLEALIRVLLELAGLSAGREADTAQPTRAPRRTTRSTCRPEAEIAKLLHLAEALMAHQAELAQSLHTPTAESNDLAVSE